MTTFLERTKFDLAIAGVVAPLASYGLHRMFPVPDVGFLAVASLMNLHASIAIRDLQTMIANSKASRSERIPKSTQQSESVNLISPFVSQHLCAIFNISSNVLLPIFARAVAQRMGIQVPGYIQTVGYISLAGSAFWIAKSIRNIIDHLYNESTKK